MRIIRQIAGWLMAAVLLCTILPVTIKADGEQMQQVTILFTHDLHSHFFPQATADGGESGGYARLKTALDRERAEHPDALTVDGGDFSIGSLVQTLFTTQAAELRTMGVLGYDATTPGNHEFDHKGTGFAQMLWAAVQSGDKLPAMLISNYKPAAENPNRLDIQRAMSAYGVQDYMLLERGGVTYGIFGIMGEDSHSCAPTSGFELGDRVDHAQRCVDALREQGAEFIICLSHSGTHEKQKKSEDEQLAKKVEGIDLIISGHTHTTLEEPILVNDTYVVSAGPYCKNLGSITLSWSGTGEKKLVEYKLIPIDETIPADQEIENLVEVWKRKVSSGYLSARGLTYDQVLTTSSFDLPTPVSGVQEGNALGELVADAYRWAALELADDEFEPDTVAVTASGVLRAPLLEGELTTAMAFDVLSMGVGGDGSSGFPLVSCYLTGKELKAIAEIDASVSPIMEAAQLYVSGMKYRFNTHRMFFNRVIDAQLYEADLHTGGNGDAQGSGSEDLPEESPFMSEIDNDRLYRVVTGMYSAQMLGTVKSSSMGLLSLEPKDAEGNPITDFSAHIIYDKNGNEIKEWYALAAYLQSFGQDGLPNTYAQTDGRKEISHSWNPIQLLIRPNWITLVTLLVIIAVVVAVSIPIRKKFFRRRYSRRGW